MTNLPEIDPALMRQMQQIDADREQEWAEYRKANRPSKLEVAAWSAIGLLTLGAVLYPIFKIMESL